MPALIYSSIPVYRMVMNLLYAGAYRKRAQMVFGLLRGNSVTELCFGDTLLAESCKASGWNWIGYDINPAFVKRAINKGYNAYCTDLSGDFIMVPSDECVMMGSLYHFGEDTGNLIVRMLEKTNRIIISEPVKNLSNPHSASGRLFAWLTSAGKGPETFRFTEESLLSLLGKLKNKHNFTFEIAGHIRKDIIIIIQKDL